jgi:hypothetical protein
MLSDVIVETYVVNKTVNLKRLDFIELTVDERLKKLSQS